MVIDEMNSMFNDLESFEHRKLWKTRFKDKTLHSFLETSTKEDLDFIRKTHSIPGLSNKKKSELLDGIIKALPHHLNSILNYLNESHYKIFNRLISNNGMVLYANEPGNILIFLKQIGLVFTAMKDGIKTIVMPDEILQTFNSLNMDELKTKASTNSEIVSLTTGMLNLYGCIDLDTYFLKMSQFINQDEEYIMSVLYLESATSYTIDFYEDYLILPSINPNLISEQQSRDVDYYPFTKETFIKASIDEYIEPNKYIAEFFRFLYDHYEISKDEATFTIVTVVEMLKGDTRFQEIFDFMNELYEIPSEIELMRLTNIVMELNNYTRKYVLKGYTPIEIRNLYNKDKKLIKFPIVGPNDLCPCGSGKKYKKCCINKNKDK